ncbi:signal peptide peptidase SppA [Chlorobium phaeovibrioides]|uniref:Signal peptide peptidase SppA n=1 Tax=Chlorobium phaeovibrioides TaxID=1094 RepID=A0A3S0L6F3_CHLPH|nr:signal peptide peptidase SppA [Chlorobium phaeovibrioides]MWV53623.1 signal peptide peptidase SppA [Chlorobium phaeovibrioides]QEQ56564.1 signal peptide peptidase SppA [Chlorobium phaeovibrioides]RTY39171.1 signal peptide peptidase SppA [Chlorobium phaeovibrioides]
MSRLWNSGKRPGCLVRGCLAVIVFSLLALAAVFFLQRSRSALPERFVLHIPLTGTVREHSSRSGALPFLVPMEPLSQQELLFMLRRASGDSRVEAVLLSIDGLRAAPAKIGELRASIEAVRKGGKRVIAFLRSPEDSDYLLASACDSIIVAKGSFMLLDGLRAETLYYKTALAKIGVSFQAAQWKEYKSGVEPYVRSSPSPQSRERLGELLDDVYGEYLGYVSRRRAMAPETLERIVNTRPLMTAEEAIRLKLVDGTVPAWQLEPSLEKTMTGRLPEEESDFFVDGRRYSASFDSPLEHEGREKLALVTISGPIVPTGSEGVEDMGEGVGEGQIRRALDRALADKNIRAIVVRIDSPGGDAMASASMLEMLDSAAVKKPLVVSMSGVAASGGYMAALAGKTIYASPLTITGSIGVYALKPEISGLAEKTGLGRSVVTRGRYADANSLFKPLDREEYRMFVEASGEIYRDFVAKVAASRTLSFAGADSLAGGRVWTGKRALAVGLVDRSGGLFDALREAQRLAGIDSTRHPEIVSLSEEQGWIALLLNGDGARLMQRAERMVVKHLAGSALSSGGMSAFDVFGLEAVRSGRMMMLTLMPFDVDIR